MHTCTHTKKLSHTGYVNWYTLLVGIDSVAMNRNLTISLAITNNLFKKKSHGAGEMTQQLKALNGLAMDLGLIPSTYMAVHNYL